MFYVCHKWKDENMNINNYKTGSRFLYSYFSEELCARLRAIPLVCLSSCVVSDKLEGKARSWGGRLSLGPTSKRITTSGRVVAHHLRGAGPDISKPLSSAPQLNPQEKLRLHSQCHLVVKGLLAAFLAGWHGRVYRFGYLNHGICPGKDSTWFMNRRRGRYTSGRTSLWRGQGLGFQNAHQAAAMCKVQGQLMGMKRSLTNPAV